MSKDKDKKPKARPDKYAEKVHIKTSFQETIGIFAKAANKPSQAKKESKK